MVGDGRGRSVGGVARTLRDLLPVTAAAVLAGEVPVDHAKAISRTCTKTARMRDLLADPVLGEPLLLANSHLVLDGFIAYCKAWALRADPDACDASFREDRGGFEFALSRSDSGAVPSGFIDPTVAEMIQTAMRAEIGVPAAGDTRSTGQRQHDALGSIFSRVLSGGGLGREHAVRPQVVVQVPLATVLAAPGTPGLPPAWLQDSRTPLPSCVLDRIGCDSEVMYAVMGTDGEVLKLGRTKRLFEGRIRRAMETRDGGCRYPGCYAPPSQCEGHHLTRWIDGGLTDLDQGVLQCWFHHTHVHAHNITITKVASGGLAFTDRHDNHLGITYPRGGPDPDPLPWPDPTQTTTDPTGTAPRPASPDFGDAPPDQDNCRGPTPH